MKYMKTNTIINNHVYCCIQTKNCTRERYIYYEKDIVAMNLQTVRHVINMNSTTTYDPE